MSVSIIYPHTHHDTNICLRYRYYVLSMTPVCLRKKSQGKYLREKSHPLKNSVLALCFNVFGVLIMNFTFLYYIELNYLKH